MRVVSSLSSLALLVASLGAASPAKAQTSGDARGADQEARATGKGIAGGALLGAEAVMLVEAVAGVRTVWPYAIGGLAGAVGGGVGGYFVEDAGTRVSVYMLAGGMALVIPTMVAVLSRTAYEPPADYTEDRGPIDEPVAEPPQPSARLRAPRTLSHRKAHGRPVAYIAPVTRSPSLLDVVDGSLGLAFPAVELRDVYSAEERAVFGVSQETELRVPVVGGVF